MNPKNDTFYHIYQISSDGSVIFYNIRDYLVFHTLLSTLSKRYKIQLLCVCLMINHVHLAVKAVDPGIIPLFMKTLLSMHSRLYNARGGVRLHYKKSYGISQKWTGKEQRSCFVYIINNPCEKNASKRPCEYRWNYLMYVEDDYPYSSRIVKYSSSQDMKKALMAVGCALRNQKYLDYSFLENICKTLNATELQQITDYIVSNFRLTDYSQVAASFGDLDKFQLAAESFAGSEYDVGEEYTQEDYRHYVLLRKIATADKLFLGNGALRVLSGTELEDVILKMISKSNASDLEISRFLHCDKGQVEDLRQKRNARLFYK